MYQAPGVFHEMAAIHWEKYTGWTLPSISGVYYYELAALSQFKHALRRSDQLVFDELFANARRHLAEAAYAAHPLPLEIFML